MVRICTGFNHPYLQRAEPYLASLRIHEPKRAHVFTVDFEPGQPLALDHTFVDFKRCCQVPKRMLQNGAFALFAPSTWSDDDVAAFTDADAVLQRPLDETEESEWRLATRDRGVLMGRNRPEGYQPLSHEATCLFPRVGAKEIERRFPGYAEMPCFNTGFVVARLSTWRELYADFCRVWPTVERTFSHYAMVQLAICYCCSKFGYRVTELPLSVHAHGHLSMPPGVTIDANNIAKHDGKTVFFRHAL